MEVIVLDGDSDETDHQQSSANYGAFTRPPPAKRRRQESNTRVSDTVDLSEVSHVSETVVDATAVKAPEVSAIGSVSEAESPSLSPQQASSAMLCIHHGHRPFPRHHHSVVMCLQQEVEDLVKEGKNVFFTGNAGTGTMSHKHFLYTL